MTKDSKTKTSKDSKVTNKTKTTSATKRSTKKAEGKKTTKRKRAKVVMPKMTNMYKPAGMSLVEWQIALRQQQAEKELFAISEVDDKFCPGEFCVGNALTRNEYKVVYRGKESIWNYCSCFDFKTSQLGTCKHLESVKQWIKKKRKKIQREEPTYTSVYVDYKGPRKVKIRIGEDNKEILERLAKDYFDEDGVIKEEAYAKFDVFVQAAKAIDENFRCYNDALDYIIEKRESIKRAKLIDERYTDVCLDSMLTVNLYPYQKEGIRFAVKAGKAIIADEMGLGKTIQAIASAEIYLREGMADNVLIVCPTSLKYQWKKEIEKFTGGDTCHSQSTEVMPLKTKQQSLNGEPFYPENFDEDSYSKVIVIEGNPGKRKQLYKAKSPYKIVSYHTMCNDVRELGKLNTDVLIMDEIQRLKNWDTLISRAARKIESRYSVLLSGTPMENKLEELYANMEFVDQFLLGPYYLFRDQHIILDPDKGGIVGYKNLNSIGEQIKDKLIRRTKKGVRLQLPKRSDQYILVPMTQQQVDYHSEFKWEVTKLLGKYQKFHYMSEQDRKRLMLLLAQMRMVADSTFILEQNLKTRFDIKVAEVMNILDSVFENGDEKVVIFSEWERMTRLVAMDLEKRGIRYEYLCGSVPAKQRGQLVENFTTLPESRVFISTDAGSTGLNLQVASILINLDLPWNPAVLEQRVARIYRLGQEKPVQIMNFVSKQSIEEGMIGKLKFKTSMFEGVLDGGADTVFVSEDKFKKFMTDIAAVMEETPEAPVVEYIDEEETVNNDQLTGNNEETVNNEGIQVGEQNSGMQLTDDNEATTPVEESTQQSSQPPLTSTQSSAHEPSSQGQSGTAIGRGQNSHREPKQLISQGISFFSGLAETLKSPEATKQLIDNIVEVDENTGEANIKIPVADKQTVMQMFSLFGKLFNS